MLAALGGVLGATAPAEAEPDPAFARQLMRERDYFRAITVYKELAFREPDPERRAEHLYTIGQAYRLGHHHELSLETLARLAPTAPGSLLGRVQTQLAYTAVALHAPGVALPHLDEARAHGGPAAEGALLQGWVRLEAGDLVGANVALALARREAEANSPTARLALDLSTAASAIPHLPRRRPWLAAVLSAVVPGAGQFYVDHPVDGVQAFGFVGAFGLTTFLAYDYDRRHSDHYVLTGLSAAVTTFFYVANILGAERAARFHNLRQQEKLLDGLRRRVLAVEF